VRVRVQRVVEFSAYPAVLMHQEIAECQTTAEEDGHMLVWLQPAQRLPESTLMLPLDMVFDYC
jgi:hypothetical protein